MSKNQLFLDFMSKHTLMTIATLNSENKSQSAVVGFGQTENLEIIFGTSKKSRKATNILNSPDVSVVIGWDEGGTMQYEGKARLLTGDDVDEYPEIYFRKNPEARKYRDDPDEIYFLITPTWIRLTEVDKNPWVIHEIKL
ncbi:MAG TPA: pyridoxamine 5'-phosphate oxidase family protein [Candidatus Dormibacteraeota bacterium]|nr:pyridoxamine 5'-phosphate oxidase family protein [Candidatus Dormibacteraeota bacterium]